MIKHGMKHTRFYRTWGNMKGRCSYKSHPSYKNYGGRGIMVCPRWQTFTNFKEDVYASYLFFSMKYGEKNTTLDRIDNEKGYFKENCQWATQKQQCNKRRTSRHIEYKGKTHTMSEWADILGLNYILVNQRIGGYGWSAERAFETPTRPKRKLSKLIGDDEDNN